ncbi:hypothetical protein B0H19DRAFT_1373337 [Mycena capillaripes]|nr:hypothetical protein B0H19DRAFT_1373337 [Mycena capillaripes]
MAGKAILAMGKAVVRSAEYIVITRRLASIRAVMPCSDLSEDGNLETMFDELLELWRPALYPRAFRTQAMQLIIGQIAGKETYHLRLSISKWEIDHEELVAFFLEIIGVVLFSKRGFPDGKLVDSYNTALPSDCHPWSPCISFMSKVAQLTDSLFHSVLRARFLEMILWVSGAQIHYRNCNENLEEECHTAFQILSKRPSSDLSVLWVEQVLRLCPAEQAASLTGMISTITVQQTWPVVERRLLEMHAHSMLKMMLQHQPSTRRRPSRLGPGGSHDFLETDYMVPSVLLHQYSATFHTKHILSASIRNFLRCVGIGGDMHKETMDHLSCVSYAKKVETLSHIIQHMIVQSQLDLSSIAPSFILFREVNPDIASNIVQFLVHVSASVQLADNPLLDAALLNVLPLLSISWERAKIHEDIYRRIYFPIRRKSRPAYRTGTLQLLNMVKSEGLGEVVDERYRNGSWVYFLQPLFQNIW